MTNAPFWLKPLGRLFPVARPMGFDPVLLGLRGATLRASCDGATISFPLATWLTLGGSVGPIPPGPPPAPQSTPPPPRSPTSPDFARSPSPTPPSSPHRSSPPVQLRSRAASSPSVSPAPARRRGSPIPSPRRRATPPPAARPAGHPSAAGPAISPRRRPPRQPSHLAPRRPAAGRPSWSAPPRVGPPGCEAPLHACATPFKASSPVQRGSPVQRRRHRLAEPNESLEAGRAVGPYPPVLRRSYGRRPGRPPRLKHGNPNPFGTPPPQQPHGQCPICMEPVLTPCPTRHQPTFWPGCGHAYHLSCIARTRARVHPSTCALCRAPWVPAQDPALSAACNDLGINPYQDSESDCPRPGSPPPPPPSTGSIPPCPRGNASALRASEPVRPPPQWHHQGPPHQPVRATATSCAASPAERSPPLPAAQPWHHAGPPQQPILAGANSWLYVPLLHASTGDLAADTLAAWRAAPQAMPWWDEARATLAAAPPQSPELLIEALRQHPAPHGAAAAAALTAARASLPRPTQVHLGWACRQLADPTGYIPAAPQEVLLQIYGGLALAAALDQHSNRFRVPPLAPVAAPPLAHPRRAPAAPSTGAVVPVPDSDEERAFTGEGPPSPTPSTISDDRSQLDRPEHTPPPAAASAIPARAWAWLDSLDLAAELRRPCAVTRSPPAFLRAHLSRAFLVPMRILTQSRATQLQQQRAWTLFLLIPRLLLHRSPDRGAEGRAALLQRAAHFQAGAWENLYGAIPPAAPRPASPAPVNPQTRRHAQACAQVRQGNLSRARHTLTHPALAPGTPATLAALRDPDRRPPQLRRPIPDHLTRPLPATPLRLTPAEIGDALRTAKRGAAPGLSGSTMDHYKVLLEDEEAIAHLTAMVNKLANADVPPPAQRGFVALGVPIGHPAFIACHLQARLAAEAELLEELPRLPDLQAAWLLLLFCAAPRAQHILRTVPPSQCFEYSTGHDAAIWDTLLALLGEQRPCPHLAEARRLAFLPGRLGGLGLTSAELLSPAAYWAGWTDALGTLRPRVPDIVAACGRELLQEGDPHAPCIRELVAAAARLDAAGWATRPAWAQLLNPSRAYGATAGNTPQLSLSLHPSESKRCFPPMTPATRALVRSQSGPAAGAWLTAIPTEPATTLAPHLMAIALRRRLRLPLPLTTARCGQVPNTHGCGRLVDPLGDHLAACPRTGALARRGHLMEQAWIKICREAVGPEGRVVPQQWLNRTTAPGVPPEDRRRLDLVVHGATALGVALCCDVTVVSPLTSTGRPLPRAATHDGTALQLARARKHRRYPELLRAGGHRFLVLGAELGGRWDQECHDLVRTLLAVRAQREPAAIRAAAISGWRRRWWAVLACALQRATASTLLGGVWLAPAQTTGTAPTLAAVLDWADPPALSRLPLR
ncbi:unnamed protein product [Cladocopium goreaui]|uniref:RING-type domain-containing protein n=1 Tax=Cladocopium goreaui TaxID=2562237 RepID=A0A9P1GAN8_9DINO|nr:unnamed protein product [Cladocopium goreaui]